MCSARRRSRSRRTACASSPPATTRTSPDPTCAPFELVPCDVFITEATFALPVFRHGDPDGEIAKLLRSVALFPERAHLVGAYSLGKAQRVIALSAPGRIRPRRSICTARWRRSRTITKAAASRSANCALCGGATKQNLAGTITLCPPSALERSVDAALSRSARRLRLRLDAGARAGAPAGRRAAAGHFRSCRLGRAHRDDRRHRRRRNLGHPRPGGRAGALVRHAAASKRGRSISSAMATRTKPKLPRPARRRHEPLRRTSGPPRLRARAQQQAAADHRLFPLDARSRARLGARGADRRASFPHAKAGPDPQPDRRAHRSGAVRAVLRLCRRSFRDRRADVACTLPALPPPLWGRVGRRVGR